MIAIPPTEQLSIRMYFANATVKSINGFIHGKPGENGNLI